MEKKQQKEVGKGGEGRQGQQNPDTKRWMDRWSNRPLSRHHDLYCMINCVSESCPGREANVMQQNNSCGIMFICLVIARTDIVIRRLYVT